MGTNQIAWSVFEQTLHTALALAKEAEAVIIKEFGLLNITMHKR